MTKKWSARTYSIELLNAHLWPYCLTCIHTVNKLIKKIVRLIKAKSIEHSTGVFGQKIKSIFTFDIYKFIKRNCAEIGRNCFGFFSFLFFFLVESDMNDVDRLGFEM